MHYIHTEGAMKFLDEIILLLLYVLVYMYLCKISDKLNSNVIQIVNETIQQI